MELATALAALAAAARSRRGHEPWLFYPRDGRWRWWSFERAWTEVERWRAVLERGEGPATGAVPAPESSPEALCFHVAASAGDFGEGGDAREARATFDWLLARAAPAREIVVVTPPAEAPARTSTDRLARLWLDWCCANLAVLALEPSRRALVGSVLWCRPTTMLVDAEQERSLAAAVTERSGGRDRRAAGLLDRLRLLLVVADDGEDDGEVGPPATRWRAWGVERRVVGEGDVGR